MKNLFTPPDREEILRRLDALAPSSPRLWGKMKGAQMLAHCANAMEMATGDAPRPQKLIGRLLGPFFKKKLLGDVPFSKNSPTDPAFVVSDERDFASEKARLATLVHRFAGQGPEAAARQVHSFLGRLTGDEWGIMMYKHLDHHLRQFGA